MKDTMKTLRSRYATRTVLLVVGLMITSTFAGASSTGGATSSRERCMGNRINDERQIRDLKSVSMRSDLNAIARDWSRKMAGAGRISHNANLSRQVAGNWSSLGENVGAGYELATIHKTFMSSRSHRANILRTSFDQMGVGIFVDKDGMNFITEVFARRTGGSEPSIRCGGRLGLIGARAGVQGQRKQLSAHLSDVSGAVRGKVIVFNVAGLSVRARTGADGIARASIVVSGLPGSYVVTARYAGSAVRSAERIRGTFVILWPYTFRDRVGRATVHLNPSTKEFVVAASGEPAMIRRASRMDTYAPPTGPKIISLSHQEGVATFDGSFESRSGGFALAYRTRSGYRVLRDS